MQCPQRGEDAAKGEVGGHALNSRESYIVDNGNRRKIKELCFLISMESLVVV